MDSYNALDHFAIQNTIARYAIALDSKNFDLLEEVFTEDVDTIYPFKGAIKGWREVADAIEKRYNHLTNSTASTRLTLAADLRQ